MLLVKTESTRDERIRVDYPSAAFALYEEEEEEEELKMVSYALQQLAAR